MESLDNSHFDVLLSDTDLSASLLALALSRSDKRILHVDPNAYYGRSNAALTLQEAAEWVTKHQHATSHPFSSARISQNPPSNDGDDSKEQAPSLAYARAYSLALSPQIIYARSALLPALVSSKTYRQLDFLVVGAWWLYDDRPGADTTSAPQSHFRRIPSSREDIFADKSIDVRSKLKLTTFLKAIVEPEGLATILEACADWSLERLLSERHQVSKQLQDSIHALTLSWDPASRTPVAFALPRIVRHLGSIGVFGPGFGAVLPKWGGLSEVLQVACRACAVGGATYMLDHGISAVSEAPPPADEGSISPKLQVKLNKELSVTTEWLVTPNPEDVQPTAASEHPTTLERIACMIDIVASPLSHLFPPIADGAPPSACAVVVFPAGSLAMDGERSVNPIYCMVHSSDTGECPEGQSIIYANVLASNAQSERWLLLATSRLRASGVSTDTRSAISLWSMTYTRLRNNVPSDSGKDSRFKSTVALQEPSYDLAFDDVVLRDVRVAWQTITGEQDGFLFFDDREVGAYDDD